MKGILETHKIIKRKMQPKLLKEKINVRLFPQILEAKVKKSGRPNCGKRPQLLKVTEFQFKRRNIYDQIKFHLCLRKCNQCHYLFRPTCWPNWIITPPTNQSSQRRNSPPIYRPLCVSEHIERCGQNLDTKFHISLFINVWIIYTTRECQ